MLREILGGLKVLSDIRKNKNDIFDNRLREMTEWHYAHSLAPEFNLYPYRKDYSTFWYGLGGVKIPRVEQEYFAGINGIKSEHYVPYGVYYYLINPYLNRWPFRRAYEDKNAFHIHLKLNLLDSDIKIRFPYMIFNRVNGKYYIEGLHYAEESDASMALLEFDSDVIIKPTFDTWGNGVMKMNHCDINKGTIAMLNKKYGLNYTVQECVKQHPAMCTFNNSSVNTVRVMTYFNSKGVYECLRTIQRFGGAGAVVDNACSGGGFCNVTPDGVVERRIFKMQSLKVAELPSTVTKEIPSYDMIVKATLALHRQLPYFDLLGWDIAVDEEGIPVILEYNCVAPSLDLPQVSGGPLFSEEELMAIMPKVFAYKNKQHLAVNQLVWEEKSGYVWCDDYGFYI